MSQDLFGTNCGNCRFFTGRKADPYPENKQHGLSIESKEELDRAERGDLITLPGKQDYREAKLCMHPKIAMPVNDRMCCAYWDNSGAYRQWKDKS